MMTIYVVTINRIDRIKRKTGLFRSEILEHSTMLDTYLCFTYEKALKQMRELSKKEYDGFHRAFCNGINAKTGLYYMYTPANHKDDTTYEIRINEMSAPIEATRGNL